VSQNRHYLHGVDYFQLLIDHHGKRLGGPGHIVRLAVEVAGDLTANDIKNRIQESPPLLQLARLRLKGGRWRSFPYFTFEGEEVLPVFEKELVSFEKEKDISIDPSKEPPFRVDIFKKESTTFCWFSFHHIFFDHIGIQAFIKALNGDQEVQLAEPNRKPMSLGENFRAYFKAANFAFLEGNFNMTKHEKKLPLQKAKSIIVQQYSFSEAERKAIQSRCYAITPGNSVNSYLLACVSKALHDEIFSKQRKHKFLWVPALLNIRGRKGFPYMLRNYLSFLFFKLKPSDFEDLPKTVKTVFGQMRMQVGKELPKAFNDFAQTYLFVPREIYYWMWQLPSMGRMSAFSFSYLGKSFMSFDTFLGKRVMDIRNYPSNAIRPGISVIFYEFRQELRLEISWVKDWYGPEVEAAVLKKIISLATGNT
jgi:hypothetical protein